MSAADQMRAMLDQLMGTTRDGENKTGVKFTSAKVCRSHLLSCCPHEILSATRMDLGACSRIHDLALRADYLNASKEKDYFYDIDAMEHLQRFIDDCDAKTELAKQRLAETQEELSAEVATKANEVHQLAEQIGQKLAKAEEKGAEGLVEESMLLMEEVEDIRKQKLTAEQDYRNSMPASSYQQQKLRVCEVCSAYLGIHDNDRRLADHFGGKLHLGFIKIREKLQELAATVEDRRVQRRDAFNLERERRSRSRSPSSRDRHRGGSSNSSRSVSGGRGDVSEDAEAERLARCYGMPVGYAKRSRGPAYRRPIDRLYVESRRQGSMRGLGITRAPDRLLGAPNPYRGPLTFSTDLPPRGSSAARGRRRTGGYNRNVMYNSSRSRSTDSGRSYSRSKSGSVYSHRLRKSSVERRSESRSRSSSRRSRRRSNSGRRSRSRSVSDAGRSSDSGGRRRGSRDGDRRSRRSSRSYSRRSRSGSSRGSYDSRTKRRRRSVSRSRRSSYSDNSRRSGRRSRSGSSRRSYDSRRSHSVSSRGERSSRHGRTDSKSGSSTRKSCAGTGTAKDWQSKESKWKVVGGFTSTNDEPRAGATAGKGSCVPNAVEVEIKLKKTPPMDTSGFKSREQLNKYLADAAKTDALIKSVKDKSQKKVDNIPPSVSKENSPLDVQESCGPFAHDVDYRLEFFGPSKCPVVAKPAATGLDSADNVPGKEASEHCQNISRLCSSDVDSPVNADPSGNTVPPVNTDVAVSDEVKINSISGVNVSQNKTGKVRNAFDEKCDSSLLEKPEDVSLVTTEPLGTVCTKTAAVPSDTKSISKRKLTAKNVPTSRNGGLKFKPQRQRPSVGKLPVSKRRNMVPLDDKALSKLSFNKETHLTSVSDVDQNGSGVCEETGIQDANGGQNVMQTRKASMNSSEKVILVTDLATACNEIPTLVGEQISSGLYEADEKSKEPVLSLDSVGNNLRQVVDAKDAPFDALNLKPQVASNVVAPIALEAEPEKPDIDTTREVSKRKVSLSATTVSCLSADVPDLESNKQWTKQTWIRKWLKTTTDAVAPPLLCSDGVKAQTGPDALAVETRGVDKSSNELVAFEMEESLATPDPVINKNSVEADLMAVELLPVPSEAVGNVKSDLNIESKKHIRSCGVVDSLPSSNEAHGDKLLATKETGKASSISEKRDCDTPASLFPPKGDQVTVKDYHDSLSSSEKVTKPSDIYPVVLTENVQSHPVETACVGANVGDHESVTAQISVNADAKIVHPLTTLQSQSESVGQTSEALQTRKSLFLQTAGKVTAELEAPPEKEDSNHSLRDMRDELLAEIQLIQKDIDEVANISSQPRLMGFKAVKQSSIKCNPKIMASGTSKICTSGEHSRKHKKKAHQRSSGRVKDKTIATPKPRSRKHRSSPCEAGRGEHGRRRREKSPHPKKQKGKRPELYDGEKLEGLGAGEEQRSDLPPRVEDWFEQPESGVRAVPSKQLTRISIKVPECVGAATERDSADGDGLNESSSIRALSFTLEAIPLPEGQAEPKPYNSDQPKLLRPADFESKEVLRKHRKSVVEGDPKLSTVGGKEGNVNARSRRSFRDDVPVRQSSPSSEKIEAMEQYKRSSENVGAVRHSGRSSKYLETSKQGEKSSGNIEALKQKLQSSENMKAMKQNRSENVQALKQSRLSEDVEAVAQSRRFSENIEAGKQTRRFSGNVEAGRQRWPSSENKKCIRQGTRLSHDFEASKQNLQASDNLDAFKQTRLSSGKLEVSIHSCQSKDNSKAVTQTGKSLGYKKAREKTTNKTLKRRKFRSRSSSIILVDEKVLPPGDDSTTKCRPVPVTTRSKTRKLDKGAGLPRQDKIQRRSRRPTSSKQDSKVDSIESPSISRKRRIESGRLEHNESYYSDQSKFSCGENSGSMTPDESPVISSDEAASEGGLGDLLDSLCKSKDISSKVKKDIMLRLEKAHRHQSLSGTKDATRKHKANRRKVEKDKHSDVIQSIMKANQQLLGLLLGSQNILGSRVKRSRRRHQRSVKQKSLADAAKRQGKRKRKSTKSVRCSPSMGLSESGSRSVSGSDSRYRDDSEDISKRASNCEANRKSTRCSPLGRKRIILSGSCEEQRNVSVTSDGGSGVVDKARSSRNQMHKNVKSLTKRYRALIDAEVHDPSPGNDESESDRNGKLVKTAVQCELKSIQQESRRDVPVADLQTVNVPSRLSHRSKDTCRWTRRDSDIAGTPRELIKKSTPALFKIQEYGTCAGNIPDRSTHDGYNTSSDYSEQQTGQSQTNCDHKQREDQRPAGVEPAAAVAVCSPGNGGLSDVRHNSQIDTSEMAVIADLGEEGALAEHDSPERSRSPDRRSAAYPRDGCRRYRRRASSSASSRRSSSRRSRSRSLSRSNGSRSGSSTSNRSGGDTGGAHDDVSRANRRHRRRHSSSSSRGRHDRSPRRRRVRKHSDERRQRPRDSPDRRRKLSVSRRRELTTSESLWTPRNPLDRCATRGGMGPWVRSERKDCNVQ